MAPGQEIAELERRKVPASRKGGHDADCAETALRPLDFLERELGKPKARLGGKLTNDPGA